MVRISDFPKFKCFAESTKLHGIARVADGSKLSIAFWAVLVVISVGMAVNDLVIMVNNYQSEPTAIQLSLVRNDNFTWPTPTLCMEILADYSTDFNILWENEVVVNDIFDKLQQFYETIVKSSYSSNITSMYPDAYDNPNLIYYPYMMLSYLTELEQNLMGRNLSYLKDNQFNLGVNDPLVAQHVQLFYDNLTNRNVSMAALRQAIGMWYCLKQLEGRHVENYRIASIYGKFENFRYFGDPDYISMPLCKANMITHLGFGIVCSKVFETPNVPLIPDYSLFEIYDTHITVSEETIQRTSAELIPSFRWHLDMTGRNVVPAGDRTDVFSWNPFENVVMEISIAREYSFINGKQRRCSISAVSQYDCIWQKRVEFVYEQCGCWPSLADTKSHKSDVNCSVNTTTPLTVYNLSVEHFCPNAKLFQPDLSSCTEDCHQMQFAFTQYPPRKTYSDFSDAEYNKWGLMEQLLVSRSAQFRFSSGSYMLISESVTTDWSTFQSVWGGSIGTWLGNKVST